MMGSALIIDNWLLQDIGTCLSCGLGSDSACEIAIDRPNNSHSIINVPESGVQLEGLLSLLVDIVLRDSLVVDSNFTGTWDQYQAIFAPLLHSGLVRSLPFKTHEERLEEAKRYVLDQLCITSTLREEQRNNEESWAARKEASNPYMSAVIWGTAGMLGRSHVYEAPYSGHPLRKRIIEQTILASPSRDAVSETLEWVAEERLRLFETKVKDGSQRTATLVLPPVAIEIIEEARDIDQLIPIAYQLRDKYAKVREWMKSIQIAMDTEDPKGIAKYKKTLSAVSKDLDRAMGNTEAGKVSLKIGIGWPGISISLGTLDNVIKKFGMRAMLNNQIFSPQGEKSIKKLLRLFDEDTSSIGRSAQEYLRVSRK
jgi:hypothetical protein